MEQQFLKRRLVRHAHAHVAAILPRLILVERQPTQLWAYGVILVILVACVYAF